jgi:hypothetical protein
MKYTIAATVLVLSTTGVMADGWPELNKATARVIWKEYQYRIGAPGVRGLQGTPSGWAAHKPVPKWRVVDDNFKWKIFSNDCFGCEISFGRVLDVANDPDHPGQKIITIEDGHKYKVTHEGNPLPPVSPEVTTVPSAHRPAPEELDGKVIQGTQGQLWENGECH